MPIALPPPGPPVSRRRMLAALAAGGLAGAVAPGCTGPAGSNGHASGWFALMSDPHVAADPRETLRGESMADNLRAVGADILRATDPPRGVVVNGDLAFKRGEPGDYRTFLDVISPLRRAGLPLHLTLGNHDDRDHVRAALSDRDLPAGDPPGGKDVGTIEAPTVRFVLLDSQNGVNVTAGRLGPEQLAWLARDLDAHPTTPAVVMVHHNLNPHSESALTDTNDLLAVLRPRRQAKAVIFGHTHVWNVREIDDIHLINLPAVGYRFLAKQPLGWVVFRPEPAGAEIELRCIGGNRREHGRRVNLTWRA